MASSKINRYKEWEQMFCIHVDMTSCFVIQTSDPVIEAPEANFMKLVQGLIEDTDGREHFLKVTWFSW